MNYYDVLGVSREATPHEIRKGFRRVMRVHHPDVNKSAESAKVSRLATIAYETLSDNVKKRNYDQSLKETGFTPPVNPSEDTSHGKSVPPHKQEWKTSPRRRENPRRKKDIKLPPMFFTRETRVLCVNFSPIINLLSMGAVLLAFIVMVASIQHVFAFFTLPALIITGKYGGKLGGEYAYRFYEAWWIFPKLPPTLCQYSSGMFLSVSGFLLFATLARTNFSAVFIVSAVYVFLVMFFARGVRTMLNYTRFSHSPIPIAGWVEEHYRVEKIFKPFLSVTGFKIVHSSVGSIVYYGDNVYPIIFAGSGEPRVEYGFLVVNGVGVVNLTGFQRRRRMYPRGVNYQPMIIMSSGSWGEDQGFLIVDEWGAVRKVEEDLLTRGDQELNERTYSTLFV